MKNALLLFGFCVTLVSCVEDSTDPVTPPDGNPSVGNKVLLLQVDATTNAFEGGKELTFDATETFTIGTEYVEPGDFGSIKLLYSELEEPLFDGTIHWMGLGERSYPETLDAADSFAELDAELDMPAVSDFDTIWLSEGEGFQTSQPDHAAIWDAIDKLEAVKQYRESNPEAKISLFLYTPSVGIGNPEEWDWIVILKN